MEVQAGAAQGLLFLTPIIPVYIHWVGLLRRGRYLSQDLHLHRTTKRDIHPRPKRNSNP